MIEIIGLIVLLAVSVVVISSWRFLKQYCLTAVEYLSKHPKLNFIIHIFTGLGSGWLIALWIPKNSSLLLGTILVVVWTILVVGVIITRYVISSKKLPKYLRSNNIHIVLPVCVGISWLSYPWMSKILTLILGGTFLIIGETTHYVFPNLVTKK